MQTGVVVLALLVLLFGVVSRPVERSVITAPMVFTAAGLLLGASGLGLIEVDLDGEVVSILAEATLGLVLFSDAARINLRRLRADAALPARMLGSLPLVILLGAGAAALLLPDLHLFEAAVLAAVLAPTDAALGQAVVTDERLPTRVRQTLNVESGLNDGIVLPFVTIFLGLAGAEEGVSSVGSAAGFVGAQVGGGLGVGIVVGALGAWMIDRASRRGWMTGSFQQLSTLAVAVLCVVGAEGIGGNGFIAAFVGGMAFGSLAQHHCEGIQELAEEEGTLLTLLVFALLGAALVPQQLQALDLPTAAYVVLSLTVVRMLPIALSLTGAGLRRDTVAFLGWFGPRGLATLLFSLLVVERVEVAGRQQIVSVALWTVLASILAHGMSAVPLVGVYSRRLSTVSADDHAGMPEMAETVEFPTRG